MTLIVHVLFRNETVRRRCKERVARLKRVLNTLLSKRQLENKDWAGRMTDRMERGGGIYAISVIIHKFNKCNIVTKINTCKRHSFVGACMVGWGQAEGRRWGVGWGGANIAHFINCICSFDKQ
jgi:hypothetical protein